MMPGLDDFFSCIKKVLGSSIGVLVVVALLFFSALLLLSAKANSSTINLDRQHALCCWGNDHK